MESETPDVRAPRVADVVTRLVDAAREAREEGLLVSTSGNISARIDAGAIAISAARSRLGRLCADDVLTVSIAGGAVVADPPAGERRPSRETPMHTSVYREFAAVGAVLHCQSPAATVLACRGGPTPALDVIPEFPVYIRRVATVPYLPPGSGALADAVVDALRTPGVRVVQLANHGQLVIGDTAEQAVERATFFELACRLFLLSGADTPLQRFTPEELAQLESY